MTILLGLTLIGVGIRVVMMLTLQSRQQRMNSTINERFKTLIAAYRVKGGSFIGELSINPAHLRDPRLRDLPDNPLAEPRSAAIGETPGADRSRRIHDAVEGALSDILLLGTEEHVRLAGQAARNVAAGRPIQTAALVTYVRFHPSCVGF